ncbi:hypothetical protein MRB53_039514 [Persea americana]|nr:hypothetical protein MRB53_039514 [Persea americana]
MMKTVLLAVLSYCHLGLALSATNNSMIVVDDFGTNTNSLRSDDSPTLKRGQRLWSTDQRSYLAAQDDGNIVVYFNDNGNAKSMWDTKTWGQSFDHLSIDDSGEIRAYEPNGIDTIWRAKAYPSGHPGPYTLIMQNDGNLVAYAADGYPYWATMTFVPPAPIKFSRVRYSNGGQGVVVYPQVRSADGSSKLWDPRDIEGTYWLLNTGETKTVDFNGDTADGRKIGDYIGGSNTVVALGFDVVYGDDDWVNPAVQKFQYDKDSKNCVTVRKYGGLRDGDAAFDGFGGC